MPILTDHWWLMILITFQYFTVLGTFIFETYILNFFWHFLLIYRFLYIYFFFLMWLRKCWLHKHFPITHYRFLSRGLWEIMFHTIYKTSYAKALSMETKNFLGPWKNDHFPMLTKELSMFLITEITCFCKRSLCALFSHMKQSYNVKTSSKVVLTRQIATQSFLICWIWCPRFKCRNPNVEPILGFLIYWRVFSVVDYSANQVLIIYCSLYIFSSIIISLFSLYQYTLHSQK